MTPNQNNRGSVLQMIQVLESCSAEDDEASPFLGVAAKALARLQSHNDTVTAAAVARKEKYEHMEYLYNELMEKNFKLAEENGHLLTKCEQLEVDESMQNDMLVVKIDDLAEENEKLESELVSYRSSSRASPNQDTATDVADSSSLSGDVYAQLDQFEDSLDMELEDLQQMGLFENASAVVTPLEKQEMMKDKSFTTPSKNLLQNKTLESCKVTPTAPNRNPLELFHRMFRTQTQDVYDDVPAMVTSDSLMSMSSDCSFSSRSSSDILSFTSTKKTMKMSPQRNAEWTIME